MSQPVRGTYRVKDHGFLGCDVSYVGPNVLEEHAAYANVLILCALQKESSAMLVPIYKLHYVTSLKTVILTHYSKNFQSHQFQMIGTNTTYQYFPHFCSDPVQHGKITMDPHIFVHVNIMCPGNRYQKLNIYISEMILCRYILVAYITI
jgi:hypothetical protein